MWVLTECNAMKEKKTPRNDIKQIRKSGVRPLPLCHLTRRERTKVTKVGKKKK